MTGTYTEEQVEALRKEVVRWNERAIAAEKARDEFEAAYVVFHETAQRADATLVRVRSALALITPEHLSPAGARILRAALEEPS